MSMKLVKRVPTGDEIKELYPLSSELKAIKARRSVITFVTEAGAMASSQFFSNNT